MTLGDAAAFSTDFKVILTTIILKFATIIIIVAAIVLIFAANITLFAAIKSLNLLQI